MKSWALGRFAGQASAVEGVAAQDESPEIPLLEGGSGRKLAVGESGDLGEVHVLDTSLLRFALVKSHEAR